MMRKHKRYERIKQLLRSVIISPACKGWEIAADQTTEALKGRNSTEKVTLNPFAEKHDRTYKSAIPPEAG